MAEHESLEDMCAQAARRMGIFLGTDLDARKIPRDCRRGQAPRLGEHETSILGSTLMHDIG